jgi:hypothetical protein
MGIAITNQVVAYMPVCFYDMHNIIIKDSRLQSVKLVSLRYQKPVVVCCRCVVACYNMQMVDNKKSALVLVIQIIRSQSFLLNPILR